MNVARVYSSSFSDTELDHIMEMCPDVNNLKMTWSCVKNINHCLRRPLWRMYGTVSYCIVLSTINDDVGGNCMFRLKEYEGKPFYYFACRNKDLVLINHLPVRTITVMVYPQREMPPSQMPRLFVESIRYG